MMGTLLLASLAGCFSQPKIEPEDIGGAAPEAVKTPEPPLPSLLAPRGDDTDRTSKNGHLVHTVDGVKVEARFGRPRTKGRRIWGDLVPYGDVWRTGADEATTVAFERDVTVNGEPLEAGTYALFSVPGETRWTVIFNREAAQWGAFDYQPGKDALRVDAAPVAAEHVEAMDIQGTDDGIALRWADVSVPLTISAAAG